MIFRSQPPVRSPLTLRAILAGTTALVRPGAEQDAVSAAVRARWNPSAFALTDSGTSALVLALRLTAALRPGRPILLPAWGCYDLATAADGADVRVAFYDLDPASLGPAWDSLEHALRLEPAAAVGVHYYGVPIDWSRFSSVVSAAGAVPIEDAAQGAGGSIAGKPLGGLGELAVLSFGRGKGITGGSGGALLARGAAWGARVDELSLTARRGALRDTVVLLAQWALTRPALYGLPASLPGLGLGQTVYHPPHPVEGLSAFAGGTLAVTFRLADQEAAARRQNATRLLEHLRGTGAGLVTAPAGTEPGWLRMPVRPAGRDHATVLRDRRARALGIYPGYPMVLADLPGFARRVVAEGPIPGARALAGNLVTLPTHGAVTEQDLDRAAAWAAEVPGGR